MRLIKLIILVAIMIFVAFLLVANNSPVTVNLLPEAMPSDLTGFVPEAYRSITLPLYMVIVAALLLGLLIGYFIEYIREYKHRRSVTLREREVDSLERKVKDLQSKTGEADDEVIAILNKA
jgi:uncharacterized integral membrane protein